MSTAASKEAARKRLRADFDTVMAYYNLSPEAKATAWPSAERSIGRALACYSAIRRSLSVQELNNCL